jgi:hypothetical protein
MGCGNSSQQQQGNDGPLDLTAPRPANDTPGGGGGGGGSDGGGGGGGGGKVHATAALKIQRLVRHNSERNHAIDMSAWKVR